MYGCKAHVLCAASCATVAEEGSKHVTCTAAVLDKAAVSKLYSSCFGQGCSQQIAQSLSIWGVAAGGRGSKVWAVGAVTVNL